MLDTPASEGLAIAVSSSKTSPNPSTVSGRGEVSRQPSTKDNLWCNHCTKPRHTKRDALKVTWETTVPQQESWKPEPI